MKKISFKTILSLIAVFLFSANVNAQMPEAITISPENGTAYDEITLTFNANLSCTPDGKQDLLGLQEVYMHSAAFELGQPAGWGNYSVQFDETGANGQYPILSANGDNTYSITYIPYEFYGFPEGTVITKITAVFNDGSWAAEGKDFLGEDCCDFNIPLNYIPDEPFVTFNCNMTKMINEGYFNPLNNSLYVEIYDFGVIEMLDLNANGIYNTAVDEGLVVNQEYIYQFRIDDATYEDIQRNFTAILGAITIDVWWNDDPIIPSFYTITTLTNPFEGGTTYGDGTFEGGTENTVLAIPNTNYNFFDWTVGGIQVSIDEEYTFILENDITLVANFQLIFGTQNYDLEFGFQFISSRLISENPDMLIVIEEILNNNLDFVRNSLGQTLRKIGPIWVNGIGDWIVDEGYLVKMFAADSFSIEGTLIDPATPIPVEAGFQFVSYFPENPMDALIAFETIIGDELDFIRNTQGQTLRKIGPIWVNGIGDCQPGEGYLVKMFANDILIYPGSSSFTCGDPFTDPRNEQTYETVQIGDKCWMAKNLNIGTMINGSEDMIDNEIIEKYCFDDDPINCEIYGGLYQWNEMMEYVSDTAVQGICPQGWHVPTDNEWKILEGTVDSQYPVGDTIWNYALWRGYDAGEKLKSTTDWYFGGNGTNDFGFTALPGGYCKYDGNFYYLTIDAQFWSSSKNISSSAFHRRLNYLYDEVYRHSGITVYGFSVRCLQNYLTICLFRKKTSLIK